MDDETMTTTLVILSGKSQTERLGKLTAVFAPSQSTTPTKDQKKSVERVESEVRVTLEGEAVTARIKGSRTPQHDGTTSATSELDHTFRLKWKGADAFELLNGERGYVELSFTRKRE